MDSPSLTLGLIGAGRIGALHAQNLCQRIPGANLLMISDVAQETARACADRFRIPHHCGDYHDILAHPDIQAVVVCSPTTTHAQIIEEAARAGKHVFCEKPIDFNLGKIDQALEAVARAGVLLQIGFNRRFDANARRIRQAIADGAIGEPHQLHIISRDPGPPPIEYIRSSGGIFLDMTIHDFDMARFLLGSEVEEIYATGSVRIDPAIGDAGDFDTVSILLKFANGAVGIIENSRRAVYGYDQRMEVFGSEGSISADNVFPNTATIRGPESIHRDLPVNFFLERYQLSFIEEMTQFILAARSGAPSPVSGLDGRIPVVMGQAALKSCRENRPVRLDEISA